METRGLGAISSEYSSGILAESGELVVPNCSASIHRARSPGLPARNVIVLNPAGLQHNPEMRSIKSTFS